MSLHRTTYLKAGYKNLFPQFLKTEDLAGSFSPYVYLLCSPEKSRLFSILTTVKIISYNRFLDSTAPSKLIYVAFGRWLLVLFLLLRYSWKKKTKKQIDMYEIIFKYCLGLGLSLSRSILSITRKTRSLLQKSMLKRYLKLLTRIMS